MGSRYGVQGSFSFGTTCLWQVEKFWQHSDWLDGRIPLRWNLDETTVQYAFFAARGWISRCVPAKRAHAVNASQGNHITHIALTSSVLGVHPHLPQLLVVNRRRLPTKFVGYFARSQAGQFCHMTQSKQLEHSCHHGVFASAAIEHSALFFFAVPSGSCFGWSLDQTH